MSFDYIFDFFSNMGINNILDVIRMFIDIFIVSVLIYWIIISVKNTRAYQLLKGVLVFICFAIVSQVLGLRTISYLLKYGMTYGVLAILVIFQPELRKSLENIGKKKFRNIFQYEDLEEKENNSTISIEEICKAVQILASNYTGALIVMERDVKLGDIIKTGTTLKANISAELMVNIFTPNTPLHDGAMIISGGEITAAGCILPLTEDDQLSHELGTRHRAGIGITETSDALVIIVSEETGQISIAIDGGLTRNIDLLSLKAVLKKIIYKKQSKKNSMINNIWKVKKSETIR